MTRENGKNKVGGFMGQMGERTLILDLKKSIPKSTSSLGEIYEKLSKTFPLVKISTKKSYEAAMSVTNRLIDYLNTDAQGHPELVDDITAYLSVLSTLVEEYEKEKFTNVGNSSPAEVLAFLMDQHGLKQYDLADEVGGQSVVSEILRGKRELNIKQVRALSKRFHISPSAFIGR